MSQISESDANATGPALFPSRESWERVDGLIDEWHAALDAAQPPAAELGVRFRQQMEGAEATFGGRLLCPYLRPNFLGQSHFAYVQSAIRDAMAAISVVERRAVEDPTFLHRMGLTEGETRLVKLPSCTARFSANSRMDTFLTPDSFKFVEYNAESPAGIAYADLLQDLYLQMPLMQSFVERHGLTRLQCRSYVLETLLEAYRAWGGSGRPHIAIVDYLDVPTRTEFDLFKAFFEAEGFPTTIADPRSLELRDGRLVTPDGIVIDILYRRLLVNELLERIDDCQALVRAVEQNAVCMVNSFRCKILHKKMLFAVLWEPDMQCHFTEAQRDVIRRHVPWTARVADGWVEFEGRSHDLVELARAEQHRMVLKPNDEYGGKGVVIGWECTAEEWAKALGDAMAYPHILQERVPSARLAFPDLENNVAPRIVDLDPFIFGDRVTGFLTRLSDTSLCNVTSGGGQVPTFLLPDA